VRGRPEPRDDDILPFTVAVSLIEADEAGASTSARDVESRALRRSGWYCGRKALAPLLSPRQMREARSFVLRPSIRQSGRRRGAPFKARAAKWPEASRRSFAGSRSRNCGRFHREVAFNTSQRLRCRNLTDGPLAASASEDYEIEVAIVSGAPAPTFPEKKQPRIFVV